MKYIITFLIGIFVASGTLFAQEKKSSDDLLFGYYNDDFKPFNKNKWYMGLTFSVLDEKLTSNSEYIGLDQIIEGKEFNYNVKVKGGYTIKNYAMLGLGISHGRDKTTATGIILFDTLNTESITNRNSFTPFLRSYYPLSKNHRINFFNEIKMDFGFGKTETNKMENNVQTEMSQSDTFVFGIGLSPGVTFFAIENFAFEIQLDVLGYEYKKVKTTDHTGAITETNTNNVDFQLNLLSLNFGLAYYFGSKK